MSLFYMLFFVFFFSLYKLFCSMSRNAVVDIYLPSGMETYFEQISV
jgi:hypothetical protein